MQPVVPHSEKKSWLRGLTRKQADLKSMHLQLNLSPFHLWQTHQALCVLLFDILCWILHRSVCNTSYSHNHRHGSWKSRHQEEDYFSFHFHWSSFLTEEFIESFVQTLQSTLTIWILQTVTFEFLRYSQNLALECTNFSLIPLV